MKSLKANRASLPIQFKLQIKKVPAERKLAPTFAPRDTALGI